MDLGMAWAGHAWRALQHAGRDGDTLARSTGQMILRQQPELAELQACPSILAGSGGWGGLPTCPNPVCRCKDPAGVLSPKMRFTSRASENSQEQLPLPG